MSIEPKRREFFRHLLIAGLGAAVLPSLMSNSAFADDLLMIDMSGKKRKDPQNATCVAAAKNLHYHDLAADLEKEYKGGKIGKPNEFKDKAGKVIPVSARDCEKCALFGLGKPGTCALISGCLVSPKGACISWSPKPG